MSPLTPHPPLPRRGEGEYDRWNVPADLEKRMVDVAREFRKAPTRGEAILWKALRGRKLAGRRFRRQQPIGPFVVDLFCAAERLIVEVDGPVHASQQQRDCERQSLLESLGFRFIRLDTALVENNLPSALQIIHGALTPLSP